MSYDMGGENFAGNVNGIPPQLGLSAMDIKPTFSSLPAAPTTFCIPSDSSNASGSSLSATLFTRLPLPQLEPKNFPGVQSWFEDIYKGRRKAGKNGIDEGNPGKSKGSILSSFMEDENGDEIPERERDAARATAKGFFNLLLQTSRAPSVWGSLAIDAQNEYLYIMESSYPFLRLCDSHWKAKRIATNSYSQWYGKTPAGQAASADRAAAAAVIDVDADDDTDKASKRPRAEEDNVQRSKRPRAEVAKSTPPPCTTKITRQRQRVCDPLYLSYMHH